MINFISIVQAQGVDIGAAFGSPWGKTNNLGQFFSSVTNLGIIFAGILFMFLVIFAGWKILSSTSGGEVDALAKGRTALTYAVIGLVVALASYLAITLIETILGVTFFTNPTQ